MTGKAEKPAGKAKTQYVAVQGIAYNQQGTGERANLQPGEVCVKLPKADRDAYLERGAIKQQEVPA